MKHTNIFRVLGIVFILSLLLAAVPATPALAANTISLSPSQGKAGDSFTVTGTDFSVSTDDRLARVVFAKEDVALYKLIDTDVTTYKDLGWNDLGLTGEEGAGDFVETYAVPSVLDNGDDVEDVSPGTYFIYVCIATGITPTENQIRSKATFTVTQGATLDPLSPASGPAGSDVTVSGGNFPASATIIIKYDGTAIAIKSGDTVVRSSGTLISTITVPASATGAHTIAVTAGSATASATFTVSASAALDPLSPASGPAGTDVTISGANFPSGATLAFKYDTTTITRKSGDAVVRSSGIFISTITIPSSSTAGAHTITVTAGSSSATATFTVTGTPTTTPPTTTPPTTTPPTTTPPTTTPPTTSLSLTPASGGIGTNVTMYDSGFKPSGTVTVKYDDKVVATATTDASGIFVTFLVIPTSNSGEHTISASDGTKTSQGKFTVVAEVITVPQPLLPGMGAKVNSPAAFDWEDITAKSPPVTYTLQIATNENFTAASIVLEKPGLTASKYTLTETEELKLPGTEKPYYWRIRAIDAAQNESLWTGAGEFYVATPFALPKWGLYTLLGIGAVLIFVIGYWLGRRTAFYY